MVLYSRYKSLWDLLILEGIKKQGRKGFKHKTTKLTAAFQTLGPQVGVLHYSCIPGVIHFRRNLQKTKQINDLLASIYLRVLLFTQQTRFSRKDSTPCQPKIKDRDIGICQNVKSNGIPHQGLEVVWYQFFTIPGQGMLLFYHVLEMPDKWKKERFQRSNIFFNMPCVLQSQLPFFKSMPTKFYTKQLK